MDPLIVGVVGGLIVLSLVMTRDEYRSYKKGIQKRAKSHTRGLHKRREWTRARMRERYDR